MRKMQALPNDRTPFVQNQKGFVLTGLYLVITVILMILVSFYGFAWSQHQASLRYEQGSQAFFLAEAAIDQKITELKAGISTDIAGAGLGRGSFAADYNAQTAMLSGTGVVSDSRRTVVTTLRQIPPFEPRAALTVQGVAVVSGTFTVDGRNHDLDGELIESDEPPNPFPDFDKDENDDDGEKKDDVLKDLKEKKEDLKKDDDDDDDDDNDDDDDSEEDSDEAAGFGVFGISTTQPNIILQGAGSVGGNGEEPTNPPGAESVEVNAPPLPSSPEAILGVAPGSLDAFKTDTVPDEFSGIVYLTKSVNELDAGGSHGTPVGSGILIVHNEDGDAQLKNLRGTFKGLIITDSLQNVHGTVIGAVAALQKPGKGNPKQCGNGRGKILYSSQAIANTPLTQVTPTSWRDLQNDPDPQTSAITYQ